MKAVVLVGGGIESMRGIEVARRLGYRAVVVDGNSAAPGMSEADVGLLVSTYDVESVSAAVTDLAMRSEVAGILSVGTDVPLTVATTAARLGLPGISISAAKLSADKVVMKQRFVESQIPTPRFWPVDDEGDLRNALDESSADLFVLKPVDSRGARGVFMVRRTDDVEELLADSLSFSTSRKCILEEFEIGPQFSSESFFTPEWHETPGFSDRNYARLSATYPHIIEDGGESPSRVSDEDVAAASLLAVRAARALGAERGIVKGDLVLTKNGPKVIEIALRLSGGWFCTHQIPLLTGVDLVEAAMRNAVGEEVARSSVRPTVSGGVAIRYFFPQEGIVTAIPAASQLDAMPGVVHHHLSAKVGDRVGNVTDHTARAGHVITVGGSRDEAVERAVTAIRELPILVTQG